MDAMSWQDYALARQLLVEMHIGTRIREAKHIEDEKARRSQKAITRRR